MILINLLPEEYRRKKRIGLPDIPAGKTAIAGVAALIAIQILAGLFAGWQTARMQSVTAEIERLKIENRDITKQKEETSAMKARLREINGLAQRPFSWTSLLNALSDSVTKGVWLNGLSVQAGAAPDAVGSAMDAAPEAGGDGRPAKKRGASAPPKGRFLRLDGSAVGQGDETATIGRFIKELKENPKFLDLFEDIRLLNITQKRIAENDVYDFFLVAVFKKDKG